MAEHIFIGVDGGGTGCRAIVGTQDRILGDASGGPANMSTDARGAVRNVLEVIMKASAAAGLREVASVRAHIGLAGVLTSEQSDLVKRVMPFKDCDVTDDRPTTLAGALGDQDGSVAAIGTGSFIGCKGGADVRFIGGWGLTLGDEASGAWLGRSALAETLLVCDGVSTGSDMTAALLARFGDDPNAIVAFTAKATPKELGDLAPTVVDAAQTGDAVAGTLMARGADYIDRALAVLDPDQSLPLCLSGGVGPAYASLVAPDTQSRLVAPKGSALDGALALARAMG